ncbi:MULTISPECIES: TetR/AcrR family transcriptional regulator [unclassified Crossiella]|uniref:TetR/AcrR family transcriptional regulator n=1 Tax=unclassified Crossiella TaxID=2620835 RepID=UPI001FFF9336|nr:MULTISPECIES: TetR/AcrR family transcriptional regulator [unclassified Crossiella]MCK2243209.1 TetR family transcriptional regulator C-terminal domain-containing protein [Crossiella sp. S99.2]MCK2254322.1 TetR family transcriptional regulator C-terminal domain-containing protein [Crossiella sp. S99.1]
MSEAPDRRQALLEATCRMISRTGVRGLRVEEVAQQAGASTALIYYYFKSRSGLLAATMRFVDERAEEYTHSRRGTGFDRLLDNLQREFQDKRRVRENSAVWGELRAAAVFDKGLRTIVGNANLRWNNAVTELIEQGREDGSIRAKVDPAAMAVRFTALVEGLSSRWLAKLISTEEAHSAVLAAVSAECRPRQLHAVQPEPTAPTV